MSITFIRHENGRGSVDATGSHAAAVNIAVSETLTERIRYVRSQHMIFGFLSDLEARVIIQALAEFSERMKSVAEQEQLLAAGDPPAGLTEVTHPTGYSHPDGSRLTVTPTEETRDMANTTTESTRTARSESGRTSTRSTARNASPRKGTAATKPANRKGYKGKGGKRGT